MAKKKPLATAEAFLRAICEEPDEDAHRLVYADWLDEHGRPERAEFIRVQCALAKIGPSDEGWPALEARQRALFGAHHRAWLSELPVWARPHACAVWSYRRGFLAGVSCPASRWLTSAAGLVRRVPLERLTLTAGRGRLAAVSRSPHLAGLSSLSLHRDFGVAEVGELAAATHLPRLTELVLWAGQVGEEGTAAVLRLPWLSRLTRLSLRSAWLTDAAAAALAAAPALAGLTFLDLSNNHFGPAAAAALASAPSLGRLETLWLSGCRIGDAGARALLGSPELTRLRLLVVSGEGVSEATRQELERRFGAAVWG
jgi:uncharacterized protein (TIGR02996 family)